MRKLEVFSEVRTLRVDKKKLGALVAGLDELYTPKNDGEISMAFVTHERLAEMHGKFCDDATPTDIITFPGTDAESFGELCISVQAAAEWVKKNGGKVEEELKRYVIHGYLHLIGYDDLTPKKRAVMKKQEARALEKTKSVRGIFKFSKRV